MDRQDTWAGGSGARRERLTVVALGDSTTATDDWGGRGIPSYAELLPAALAGLGVEARVVSAGIGDTTTRDARERLDRDVRAFSPDLVVVQFGINDSWIDAAEGRREPRLTRVEYRDDLVFIVRTLKADGARIVLMTPNPMRWDRPQEIAVFRAHPGLHDTADERGLNGLLDLYAETVREVARKEDVPLVDVHRAFEAYGHAPGQSIRELLIAGDGIHPSAAGQRLVCRLLTATLAGLLRP
ncbi:MAG TPA: SGNH/GDSL hydrolase family protein [Thermoleophilia bacterium]|nr:SGNH/GDSL hydrolase family protein [Thermoleophilia bacterium]